MLAGEAVEAAPAPYVLTEARVVSWRRAGDISAADADYLIPRIRWQPTPAAA